MSYIKMNMSVCFGVWSRKNQKAVNLGNKEQEMERNVVNDASEVAGL